jgi:ATP-dependent protease HslVU (ClpYQ) peptidase subunit
VKGTCIVGIAHKGVVWMGCDSMASDGRAKMRMLAPKVVRTGDLLVGVCGSLRVRDTVEYVALPERGEAMKDDREYLVRSYVPHLRAALKDAGVLATDDGLDEVDSNMLLAYRKRLYSLYDDFSLLEHAEWAVGSGSEYALGSLFSTSGDPAKRIKTALQAACEFSPSCGPPFVLEKL